LNPEKIEVLINFLMIESAFSLEFCILCKTGITSSDGAAYTERIDIRGTKKDGWTKSFFCQSLLFQR